MTSEQWEEATEVDVIEARKREPEAKTDPAPPWFEEITEVSCIVCGAKDDDHDAACPRQKCIAP